jgi:hypothetical protein
MISDVFVEDCEQRQEVSRNLVFAVIHGTLHSGFVIVIVVISIFSQKPHRIGERI